jgi:Transmembrane secretion effector
VRRLGPALAERDFALLWLALLGMGVSLQMLEVAIGWQVYGLHHSALDLGLIGLAEFVPMFVLAIPAGNLADRLPRRLVFGAGLAIGAAVGAGLALLTALGTQSVAPFFALALGAGVSMAIGMPAARALPAVLVPSEALPNAMTLRSMAIQAAQVVGPALGGLLYPLAPSVAYGTAGAACLVSVGCVGAMSYRQEPGEGEGDVEAAPALRRVLGGIDFIGHTPILLGAILLDLLAVLFGGAVALLPLFASSILHVGPTGLGILRAAPAIGAICGGLLLTRRPLEGNAGRTLLLAVGGFGASIVVFGLSHSYVLSMLALGVSGLLDMFSMNIRSTTVALATPDRLRGRVLAVEMVFIGASNQLGAFESGLAAFLLGAVPAVVAGGALTDRDRGRLGKAVPGAGGCRPDGGRAPGERPRRAGEGRAAEVKAQPRSSTSIPNAAAQTPAISTIWLHSSAEPRRLPTPCRSSSTVRRNSQRRSFAPRTSAAVMSQSWKATATSSESRKSLCVSRQRSNRTRSKRLVLNVARSMRQSRKTTSRSSVERS